MVRTSLVRHSHIPQFTVATRLVSPTEHRRIPADFVHKLLLLDSGLTSLSESGKSFLARAVRHSFRQRLSTRCVSSAAWEVGTGLEVGS